MPHVFGGPIIEVKNIGWRLPFICFVCKKVRWGRFFLVKHIKSSSDGVKMMCVCHICCHDELHAYHSVKNKIKKEELIKEFGKEDMIKKIRELTKINPQRTFNA